MKKKLFILAFGISFILAKSFTVSDPPMIYIYHFVSYDTTSIILHGGQQDASQNKILRLPMFNRGDVSTGGEDLVVGKPLDPKLVSAMVTSAVAKNTHVNIAGESIQNRIKTDNFIKLVKSYDYPKRTDFIFIGEINTVATQYEIDLKLIDVSTQIIVSAESFNLPFKSMNDLRTKIDGVVTPLMQTIVTPFIGNAYVRVDSTSRDRIRWDDISIRPLKTVVGSDLKKTSESDFAPYQTETMPIAFLKTHDKLLSKFLPTDYKLVGGAFLAGNYRFRAFLKNNEKPFETDFTVKAGDLNEIHMSLPYTPPPKDTDGDGIPDKDDACPETPGEPNDDPEKNGCPPPPPPKLFGNITVLNVWSGVGFELRRIDEEYDDEVIMEGHKDNAELTVNSDPHNNRVNKDKTSVTVLDLPLGTYVRESYARSDERFPGKHYVNLFSDNDTLKLNKAAMTIKTKIADQNKTTGREVIIYFDPFTPEEDDEYRLFLDETASPFAITRIVGEIHIVGFPTNHSGTIKVEREGFQDGVVSIKRGSKKLYLIANLNNAGDEPEETVQGKLGSLWK